MKSEILVNILGVLAFILYVVLTSGILNRKTKQTKQELERKVYVIEWCADNEWKEFDGKYFTDFKEITDKMGYYKRFYKHHYHQFRIKQIE